MKEIGAIFVVSISEIRTVQLAAIKRRYNDRVWNFSDRRFSYSSSSQLIFTTSGNYSMFNVIFFFGRSYVHLEENLNEIV